MRRRLALLDQDKVNPYFYLYIRSVGTFVLLSSTKHAFQLPCYQAADLALESGMIGTEALTYREA